MTISSIFTSPVGWSKSSTVSIQPTLHQTATTLPRCAVRASKPNEPPRPMPLVHLANVRWRPYYLELPEVARAKRKLDSLANLNAATIPSNLSDELELLTDLIQHYRIQRIALIKLLSSKPLPLPEIIKATRKQIAMLNCILACLYKKEEQVENYAFNHYKFTGYVDMPIASELANVTDIFTSEQLHLKDMLTHATFFRPESVKNFIFSLMFKTNRKRRHQSSCKQLLLHFKAYCHLECELVLHHRVSAMMIEAMLGKIKLLRNSLEKNTQKKCVFEEPQRKYLLFYLQLRRGELEASQQRAHPSADAADGNTQTPT